MQEHYNRELAARQKALDAAQAELQTLCQSDFKRSDALQEQYNRELAERQKALDVAEAKLLKVQQEAEDKLRTRTHENEVPTASDTPKICGQWCGLWFRPDDPAPD